jgi:hypothetical protein
MGCDLDSSERPPRYTGQISLKRGEIKLREIKLREIKLREI